jgi:two-component system sensor histidine kinase MtrB
MKIREFIRQFLKAWRGSLTLRILLTSISMSVVIATCISLVSISSVRDSLLNDRKQSSLTQAQSGIQAANRVVASFPDSQISGQEDAVVDAIVGAVSQVSASNGDFEVLLIADPSSFTHYAPERGTNEIAYDSVSNEMRKAIRKQSAEVLQIADLVFLDGATKSGIIIGAPIEIPVMGKYELYQLFPLQSEIENLSLMQSAISLAAGLMALAFIFMSVILTRQVVKPIRQVAASAERLKAGRLTERIAVRTRDDLGKLAESFNSMAESMQSQIQRLEALSKVQQQFVSDVSHELRTPLTTISMAAELLHASKDEFDPASAKAASLLMHQTNRFENLLNDLLEISRLDAGVARLDAVAVDVGGVAARVIEGLEEVARDLGVKVQLEVDQSTGTADCDEKRVDRIVRNLISNAIEHAGNSVVRVCVAGNSDSVSIAVRDKGIGLQPGESSLVFNRFWRADPSRQRTLGGTGLGLAISLEDARIHGGWLEATGAPGLGANFRLTLPRVVHTDFKTPALPLELEEIDSWHGV